MRCLFCDFRGDTDDVIRHSYKCQRHPLAERAKALDEELAGMTQSCQLLEKQLAIEAAQVERLRAERDELRRKLGR